MNEATFHLLNRAAKMIEKDGTGAYFSCRELVGPQITDALLVYHIRRNLNPLDHYPPPEHVDDKLKEILKQHNIYDGFTGPIANPHFNYAPTKGERVVVVGGCHPGMLGRIVEVVDVVGDVVETRYFDLDHGWLTTCGQLGGFAPYKEFIKPV